LKSLSRGGRCSHALASKGAYEDATESASGARDFLAPQNLIVICLEEWLASPAYRSQICGALQIDADAGEFPKENTGAEKVPLPWLLGQNAKQAYGYGAPFGFTAMSTDLKILRQAARDYSVEGTLSDFLKRVEALSKQRRTLMREERGQSSHGPSPWHEVPEPLKTALAQRLSTYNANLATLDPRIDWRAHGYVLEVSAPLT